MSTGTDQTATETITTEAAQLQPPSLLDQVVDATLKQKVQVINKALTARVDEIERLLPDFMKNQAPRLIARAMQYFARGDWKLQKCTPASFVKCIMEAAEMGYAIDGKMAHAVARTKKQKGQDGQWSEWFEAGVIFDYKSVIATAKRCKAVQDAHATPVYEQDEFSYGEENGKQIYKHTPDIRRERDSLDGAIGILSVANHHEGWYRADFMPMADVWKIRNSSPGYKPDDAKVPWNKHPGEMAKKTGIKRLLKTFSDDPGLVRLMEIDDSDYADDLHANITDGVADEATPTGSNGEQSRTQALAESLRQQTTSKQADQKQPDPIASDFIKRAYACDTVDQVKAVVQESNDSDMDTADKKKVAGCAKEREKEIEIQQRSNQQATTATTPAAAAPPEKSETKPTADFAKLIADAKTIDAVRDVAKRVQAEVESNETQSELIKACLHREKEIEAANNRAKQAEKHKAAESKRVHDINNPPEDRSWPLLPNGKMDWKKSNQVQRRTLVCDQIKTLLEKEPDAKNGLEQLRKFADWLKPRKADLTEDDYTLIMSRMTAAEREYTQRSQPASSDADDDSPPDFADSTTAAESKDYTQDEKDSLAYIRQEVASATRQERLDELRTMWDADKDSVSADCYADGLALIAAKVL